MKIVINVCFGGFSLSDEAEDLYMNKKGKKLYRYKQIRFKWSDGDALYVREPEKDKMMASAFTKDHGDEFKEFPKDKSHFSSRDIDRKDPVLIEIIEKLGEKADGDCARLRVVEIPDGTEYEIDEYDGNEHIAEVHKTWR